MCNQVFRLKNEGLSPRCYKQSITFFSRLLCILFFASQNNEILPKKKVNNILISIANKTRFVKEMMLLSGCKIWSIHVIAFLLREWISVCREGDIRAKKKNSLVKKWTWVLFEVCCCLRFFFLLYWSLIFLLWNSPEKNIMITRMNENCIYLEKVLRVRCDFTFQTKKRQISNHLMLSVKLQTSNIILIKFKLRLSRFHNKIAFYFQHWISYLFWSVSMCTGCMCSRIKLIWLRILFAISVYFRWKWVDKVLEIKWMFIVVRLGSPPTMVKRWVLFRSVCLCFAYIKVNFWVLTYYGSVKKLFRFFFFCFSVDEKKFGSSMAGIHVFV